MGRSPSVSGGDEVSGSNRKDAGGFGGLDMDKFPKDSDLTQDSTEFSEDASSENSENSTVTTSSETTSNTDSTNNPENSEMVWVGDSGTKYHNEGCRTLKGKGHQITLQQALAEGREPCKVCH